MRQARLDQAFASYRSTGDPAHLARVFDATAGELFRLAWHLIGERHAAEDLVQTTFLVAMEQARSFTPDRQVMPWLCGILANRARDLRRRQRQPANLVLPELPVVDTHAEVARNELSATVAATIRAMQDPYRQVLLLHLEHGFCGKEIAETLARPEATVRSQLHRGLDQLRKALPVGIAGSAGAIAPAAGLHGVRTALFGQLGGTTTFTWLGVAWTMKKLAVVAFSLLLGLACVWPWLPSAAPPLVATPTTDAGIPANAMALVSAPLPHETTERQPAPPPAKPTTSLEISVTRNGITVPDVVMTWTVLQSRAELWQRSVRTDGNGLARFDDVLPGRAIVRSDRGGYLEVDVQAGAAARATLSLPGGIEVRGRVVDERHDPVAGAEVWLRAASGGNALTAYAAADGTFVLHSVAVDCELGAWAEGRSTLRGTKVKAGAGDHFDCTLTLPAAGARIEGTVRDRAGLPIAGATVQLGEHEARSRADPDLWREPLDLPMRTHRTDAEGRFAIVGAPRGHLHMWAASPRHAGWHGEIDLGTATEVLSIVLASGATVHGQVRERDGQPAANVWVTAEYELKRTLANRWQGNPGWWRVDVQTDADGRYALTYLSPSRNTLRVQRKEELCAAEFDLTEGQSVDWSPQFGSGPCFTGTVVDPDGTPLVDWEVQMRGHANFQRRTDEQGRFRIEVEAGVYELWLVEPRVGVVALKRHDLSPPPEPLRLEVPWSRLPSARITGELHNPDGSKAIAGRFELLHLGEDGATTGFHEVTWAAERFTTNLLFPGRYLLRATVQKLGELRAGPFELARGQILDIGALRFEPPGQVTVRVVLASPPQPTGKSTLLVRAEREPIGMGVTMQDGVAKLGNLQPGVYFVTTWSNLPAATLRVEVQPGVHSEVDLHVPAGVPCVVRFPAIPCDYHLLHQTWRDPNGAVVFDSFGSNDRRARGFDMSLRIAPGHYTITVEDASGRSATTTADVHAAEPPVIVVLPLPGAK